MTITYPAATATSCADGEPRRSSARRPIWWTPRHGAGQALTTDRGDLIKGTGGKDDLSGLAGDDTIKGNKGGDILHGNAGETLSRAEDRRTAIYGDDGDDTIYGKPRAKTSCMVAPMTTSSRAASARTG